MFFRLLREFRFYASLALKSVQLTGKNGFFKPLSQLAYLLYYETKFKSSCFARVFSNFFKNFYFFGFVATPG
jgi:hypothetical protein